MRPTSIFRFPSPSLWSFSRTLAKYPITGCAATCSTRPASLSSSSKRQNLQRRPSRLPGQSSENIPSEFRLPKRAYRQAIKTSPCSILRSIEEQSIKQSIAEILMMQYVSSLTFSNCRKKLTNIHADYIMPLADHARIPQIFSRSQLRSRSKNCHVSRRCE